jgi:hypothetical protein
LLQEKFVGVVKRATELANGRIQLQYAIEAYVGHRDRNEDTKPRELDSMTHQEPEEKTEKHQQSTDVSA